MITIKETIRQQVRRMVSGLTREEKRYRRSVGRKLFSVHYVGEYSINFGNESHRFREALYEIEIKEWNFTAFKNSDNGITILVRK